MSAKDQHQLSLSFTKEEWRLLQQAARAHGNGDLPAWARHVVLEAAKHRMAELPVDSHPSAEEQSLSFRPKCGCGATASPNGQCDGSCIMRF